MQNTMLNIDSYVTCYASYVFGYMQVNMWHAMQVHTFVWHKNHMQVTPFVTYVLHASLG